MGHYYTLDGLLVEGNIYTARKQGLVPSVTTVLGIIEKPHYHRMDIEQAVAIAYNTPLNFMDEQEYVQVVIDKAMNTNSSAAETGTRVHAFIESVLKGIPKPEFCENDSKAMLNFVDYIMATEYSEIMVERVIVCDEYKFACRIDALLEINGETWLIDWKTQKIGKDGKEKAYPDWCDQIAAQALALQENGYEINHYANVILPVNKSGFKVVEYDAEKILKAQQEFCLLREYYRMKRGI